MKRVLLVVAHVSSLMMLACGGSSSTTAPSTPSTPTPTTFSLSGNVSVGGIGIAGALLTIADGANAGKTATTDAAGAYRFTGLASGGFTMNVTAATYISVARSVTLITDTTVNVSMLPTAVWTQSGTGDNVFTVPNYVTKVRIDATYPGSCQNFIVHLSTQIASLVNIIIGSCSVADTKSPFSGTYAIAGGGQIQITSSTGINWTFTEVR